MRKLRRLYRLFLAARTTVILLCLLALLLLLNVALPQASVVGEEGLAAMVEGRPVARFFLVDLGLGRMSTSPVFLAVLALFFLNLTLVLLSRLGPTWRRIALRPRNEDKLEAWARMKESLSAALPDGWSAAHAAWVLRGFGYQVRRQGERAVWGVKHRTAPLGFLLFHLSFFLLCAGGVLIYYTRFVGFVVLSEGEEFRGQYSDIRRRPPIGGPPALHFSLGEVETRFELGEPVHLGASFRFRRAGASVERRAQVNQPAHWGAARLLVLQAGLAPVFWVQDARGFTRDRVVVPVRTRSGRPTEFTLDVEGWKAVVHPLPAGTPFPSREELAATAMTLQVMRNDEVLFEGDLQPGQAVALDEGRIVLEEMRYWVGTLVVVERGPGVLIAGFVALVAGLLWRLLWYRREVALTWGDGEFRIIGRSEYFSGRFRDELRSIRVTLERGPDGAESRGRAGAGGKP